MYMRNRYGAEQLGHHAREVMMIVGAVALVGVVLWLALQVEAPAIHAYHREHAGTTYEVSTP